MVKCIKYMQRSIRSCFLVLFVIIVRHCCLYSCSVHVPLVGSICLEVPANYIIILAVVIPMKTVMERPIREVDQRSLQRTTVILAVLQQEAVSWILFSAVVAALSR